MWLVYCLLHDGVLSVTRISDSYDRPYTNKTNHWFVYCLLQPIADRVAQNLESISKKFQFSTRCTRILMGFIISTICYLALIANPMGRIVVRLKGLEIISRFCTTLSAIGCTRITADSCIVCYTNYWFVAFVHCLLHEPVIRVTDNTRISESSIVCWTNHWFVSFVYWLSSLNEKVALALQSTSSASQLPHS